MEQVVTHKRPVIEEFVYSPQNQAKKHIKFALLVVEEHNAELSQLDLEEIQKQAREVDERCRMYLARRMKHEI